MTDYETMVSMLDRASIKHATHRLDELFRMHRVTDAPVRVSSACITLTVEGGYDGFCSVFTFTTAGTLLKVEAFE